MTPMDPPVFVDRIVRQTPLVTVGEFRCTVGHPRFEDSGRIREHCVVFPQLAVAIAHEHEAPFVANAAVATFYNAGQAYRRLAISPGGDRCDWFGLAPALVDDVWHAVGAPCVDTDRPFRWTRGPMDPSSCLEERRFMRALRDGVETTDAEIEDLVVSWLMALVPAAGTRPVRPGRVTPRLTDAVHEVERLLSLRPATRASLSGLARTAGVSVFHLCRAFRTVTGRSMHAYRETLRVRQALDRLLDGAPSITDVAIAAGFSSHSHFTAAFRREFGHTPSAIRASTSR